MNNSQSLLCLATHNRHKVSEISAILNLWCPGLIDRTGTGLRLITLADLQVPDDVAETGQTFAENARIKAVAAYERTGLWSLADDSGLQVDALRGAPGIYSARYGGEPYSDQRNLDRLLRDLKDVSSLKRQARFVCAVCLCGKPAGQDTPRLVVHERTCEGFLRETASGQGGFGYDPVFVPTFEELGAAGLPALLRTRTFAELHETEKNRLSHRARALQALLPDLRSIAARQDA